MWIANLSIGFLADFGLAGSEWESALNTVVFTTICNVCWPSADLKLAGSRASLACKRIGFVIILLLVGL